MTNKDRLIGYLIFVGSIVGVGVYAWLLHAYTLIVLQATAFIAVTVVLGILAWIEWTLATTPSLKPIDIKAISSMDEKRRALKSKNNCK